MTDEEDITPDETEATAGWLAVAGAVADGRMAPDAGIERLRLLQAQFPDEAGWLEEEVETIRWTFGMDVEDVVRGSRLDYWEKVLSITEGLLEERVTPSQAIELLGVVRAIERRGKR